MTPKQDLKGKTPYVELSKLDAEQTSLMYNCPGKKKNKHQLRPQGEVVIREKNTLFLPLMHFP